ncbi:DotH/IcmK family type IV secretion protein [Castellaniella sp.]|uniref:DotH/IcmK family type IV secretion protein n=1 Tax=Castellaniella sp. TaxID=1955812 RepID=UPI002AFEC73F|nr:DotH/IcmK family type IV secretion protein [Castellaniella sp.]
MLSLKKIVAALGLSIATAHAQEAPPPPPPMPPSGLGNSVVYPSNAEISEGMIRDLEELQLTPDQISRVKKIYLEREANSATPYQAPANPITRTLAVNLEPGVAPPVIRLSRGQQSSIVFSDVNGNPWLIKRVSLNRELFKDGQGGTGGNKEEDPTNVLSLEPIKPVVFGNVAVTLNGLSTPVIFTLMSNQADVDVRVDAKVPGRNPDSGFTVSVTSMPTIDQDLAYFMDGTPPPQAKRLRVRGLENTTAWTYRNKLYLRTHAAAQWPAYQNAARSTSGVSVYRYSNLHDSVTLLTGGRAVTIFIDQGSGS